MNCDRVKRAPRFCSERLKGGIAITQGSLAWEQQAVGGVRPRPGAYWKPLGSEPLLEIQAEGCLHSWTLATALGREQWEKQVWESRPQGQGSPKLGRGRVIQGVPRAPVGQMVQHRGATGRQRNLGFRCLGSRRASVLGK